MIIIFQAGCFGSTGAHGNRTCWFWRWGEAAVWSVMWVLLGCRGQM